MTESAARKASGWGAGLPPFVHRRMTDLEMRPSLRTLAAKSGISAIVLHDNFSGERDMKLKTAIKLAVALDVSLDELAANL
jgi:hypothetical protein